MKISALLCVLICIVRFSNAFEQVSADPNIVGCGIEYHSTLQVKAGEVLDISCLTIGGFIESRNEARFNQGLLPNHNWRGYFLVTSALPLIRQMQLSLNVVTALEHESAHATMGIVEPTNKPYEMIYDHTYRKHTLNGVKVGPKFRMFDERNSLLTSASFDVYALSKNTPELPGLKTAASAGFSCGGVYRYCFAGYTSAFLSVYERYIARSATTISAVQEGALYKNTVAYPVISSVSTFTLCAGVATPLFRSRHLLEIYARWLRGNIYGYVDSRDTRDVFAIGTVLTSR